jgi:hypothetical protein
MHSLDMQSPAVICDLEKFESQLSRVRLRTPEKIYETLKHYFMGHRGHTKFQALAFNRVM